MNSSVATGSAVSVDDLVTRIVYQIATGAWPEGQRLPSLREGSRQWGLERRGVMQAYTILAKRGMIIRAPRSGYFVASSEPVRSASRHRFALEHLLSRVDAEIRSTTDLSPLGVLRYLTHLAEARAGEAPELAFVECTRTQAEGHAAEIRATLDAPCMALTIEELNGRADHAPNHVRCIFISAFHTGEVDPGDRAVHEVPLRMATSLRGVSRGFTEFTVVEYDRQESANLAEDLRSTLGTSVVDAAVVDREHDGLGDIVAPQDRLVFLAPRVWGAVDVRWREHPRVCEARFEVRPEAWPAMVEAAGLPLGTATPPRRVAAR